MSQTPRSSEPSKSSGDVAALAATDWVCALLLTVALLLLATPVLAAGRTAAVSADLPAATTSLVTLGMIDGEADDKLPSITLRLDRAPSWTDIGELQDHGSFLQLTLPGILVPEPGKFYDGVKPFLPKVAVFQLTPSDAGIRFFVSADAAKVKQFTHAKLLGNRIVLTLDQAKLKQALAQADIGTDISADIMGPPAPNSLSADQVIARTDVRRDETAPSELVKNDLTTSALKSDSKQDKSAHLTTGSELDLRDKLLKATLFSVAMLIFLGGSWVLKPYLRRRRALAAIGQGGELPQNPLTIKTLASLSVAARQKVSLIQVGGERFLIGVTPEHVSFLTSIGQNQSAHYPGGQATAAPSAAAAVAMQAAAPLRLGTAGKTGRGGRGSDETSFNQALADADDSGATINLKQPLARPAQPQRRPSAPDSRDTRPAPDRGARGSQAEAKQLPSQRGAPSQHGAPVAPRRTGSRINIAVSEDGVEDFGPGDYRANGRVSGESDDYRQRTSEFSHQSSSQSNSQSSSQSNSQGRRPAAARAANQETEDGAASGDGQQAIDDVTRLIREKLKNLRTI